jgi:hypothetical protein
MSAPRLRGSFAQRTQVRFRHHFRDALQVTKFLGEKSGLYMYEPEMRIALQKKFRLCNIIGHSSHPKMSHNNTFLLCLLAF